MYINIEDAPKLGFPVKRVLELEESGQAVIHRTDAQAFVNLTDLLQRLEVGVVDAVTLINLITTKSVKASIQQAPAVGTRLAQTFLSLASGRIVHYVSGTEYDCIGGKLIQVDAYYTNIPNRDGRDSPHKVTLVFEDATGYKNLTMLAHTPCVLPIVTLLRDSITANNECELYVENTAVKLITPHAKSSLTVTTKYSNIKNVIEVVTELKKLLKQYEHTKTVFDITKDKHYAGPCLELH